MQTHNAEKKTTFNYGILSFIYSTYLSDWRLGVDLTLELSSLVSLHHDGILGTHLHSGKV
jgi:hypothetical protein